MKAQVWQTTVTFTMHVGNYEEALKRAGTRLAQFVGRDDPRDWTMELTASPHIWAANGEVTLWEVDVRAEPTFVPERRP